MDEPESRGSKFVSAACRTHYSEASLGKWMANSLISFGRYRELDFIPFGDPAEREPRDERSSRRSRFTPNISVFLIEL